MARALAAMCVATCVAVTSLAARGQDAGLAAVWKDRETRTNHDPRADQTTRFIAILPACDHASPTMTFQATFATVMRTHVLAFADFLRVASSRRIGMNVFGFSCRFDATELRTLQQFATSVLPSR